MNSNHSANQSTKDLRPTEYLTRTSKANLTDSCSPINEEVPETATWPWWCGIRAATTRPGVGGKEISDGEV